MSYLAQVTYTGNGSTTQYSITFPYIDSTHIKAFINGTQTTAFTVSSSTLTFTSAPANSSVIRIERQTPTNARIVDFTDGSVLTEGDLDKSADQNFFIAQEITDNSLSKLGLDTDDKFDADNKVIKNLANPVNAQDAVTKHYLENTWLSPTNKTALTTVNANIANINAVNSNATNINSAVSNATNINTVATNIGSVNTVATDIAKVIAVANDLAEAVSEVETVADDLNEATSEIDTVATSITNVDTVGTNIANVNTVAGISSNVTTVAGNNSNVSTVAGISSNVTTLAGISSDVTTLAGISSDITTVRGINLAITNVSPHVNAIANIHTNLSNVLAVNTNSANINTVAGNNSNISTVAGVSSDVTTVAGISSDVQAVENIASNVTTVAGMSTAINSVNSNSSNINTVAGAITNVNNVGGSIANVNTVASNLSGVNSFGERYRVSANAPTTSLDSGDLWFDSTNNILKVYGASGFQSAGSSVNGTSERFKYTISGTPTTVSGNDDSGNSLNYDAGFIDVYLNGIKMVNGTDVTVTSGNSVVFASALTNGDVVDIITFGTFNIASMNASNLTSGTVPSARLGTITNFTSTGIDDNATSTAITINSNEQVILHGGQIQHNNNTSNITYSGGNNSNAGANLTLFGGSHASTPNVARFRSSATEVMRITSSGKVGIGTTAPVGGLEVNNSSGIKITRPGYSQNMQLYPANNNVPTILGVGGNGIHIGTTTTTGIHVDGSDNVGIGTTSPFRSSVYGHLTISNTQPTIFLEDTNSSSYGVGRFIFEDANLKYLVGSRSGNTTTNSSEYFRIDSSGNVLIGTTTDYAVSSSTVTGTKIRNDGIASIYRDNATPLYVGRQNGDGTLIDFRRSGTTVGTIGSYLGSGISQFFISGADTGFKINSSVDVIAPSNASGANRDNAITLGDAGNRWKDIYLGGGVYLGGTGTANKLDDYEEGTFNPTLTPSTSGSFTINNSENELGYKKIGSTVYVQGRITFTGNSSPSGTSINVGNLPFTPASPSEGSGWFGGMCAISNDGSNTFASFPITAYSSITTKITTNLVSSLSSQARLHFNFFYYTNA